MNGLTFSQASLLACIVALWAGLRGAVTDELVPAIG
jgi:hypothetical protein